MKSWREIAAPIIDKVLDETKGKSLKEIRAALKEAYPFGMREYYPYKIWCNEIRVQLEKRKIVKPRKVPVKSEELPLWLKLEKQEPTNP